MRFLEHCYQAQATFGKPYTRVHKWLDEFAGKKPHGMRHRRFRHHEAGIMEVQRLWGDEADLCQVGWKV